MGLQVRGSMGLQVHGSMGLQVHGSMGPWEERMRNLRYSPFFILPSSHTTIEATVSLP